MPRRRPGSVRFDPYYKVQVWQPRSLAWRDIQKAHDTEEEGWAAAAIEAPGELVRLMRIYPGGREPLPSRQL